MAVYFSILWQRRSLTLAGQQRAFALSRIAYRSPQMKLKNIKQILTSRLVSAYIYIPPSLFPSSMKNIKCIQRERHTMGKKVDVAPASRSL
jgi:hypothetical protein